MTLCSWLGGYSVNNSKPLVYKASQTVGVGDTTGSGPPFPICNFTLKAHQATVIAAVMRNVVIVNLNILKLLPGIALRILLVAILCDLTLSEVKNSGFEENIE